MMDLATTDRFENELLALTADDQSKMSAIAEKLNALDASTIVDFGRDVATHTSEYTDKLLSFANKEDLEAIGTKLTEIVVTAKMINLNGFKTRSNLPVIGPLINRFRLTKEKLSMQFESSRSQIEILMNEVSTSQQQLKDSNQDLEFMFSSVIEEFKLYALHIQAAKQRLAEWHVKIEDMTRTVSGSDDAQLLNDMHNNAAFLDKRIADLQAIQHSALQTLPIIRLMQQGNIELIEKFYSIKSVVLPSWKRQFVLALSLNQQKNGAALACAIDDATNAIMKDIADMLNQNAISTARSNQRLSIDVDTLKYVQDKLIATVEDVIKVQRTGLSERRKVESQLANMREDLNKRLTRQEAKSAA